MLMKNRNFVTKYIISKKEKKFVNIAKGKKSFFCFKTIQEKGEFFDYFSKI